MKKSKTKCDCHENLYLYLEDFGDGQVSVAIGKNLKQLKANEREIIIDRKKLISLLK